MLLVGKATFLTDMVVLLLFGAASNWIAKRSLIDFSLADL